MWTVDANCPRCKFKTECQDRVTLIKGLSSLANETTSDDAGQAHGDGRLVIACQDFKPE